MLRIGFLGVGHLAAALIGGLLRSGLQAEAILLSKRGQGSALGERHGIRVAASNAELVDESDIVVLAVRPRDAVAALAGLPWRDGQVLASACAGVGLGLLAPAVEPARAARIMPLTAAEFGASPITLVPEIAELRAVLGRLGPVIGLGSEAEFETATVGAAIYGWVQVLLEQSIDWAASRGLEKTTARTLMAATFVAAGRNVADSAAPVADLLHALVTPDGITAHGLAVLDRRAVPDGWVAACDAVFEKLTGQPPTSR